MTFVLSTFKRKCSVLELLHLDWWSFRVNSYVVYQVLTPAINVYICVDNGQTVHYS